MRHVCFTAVFFTILSCNKPDHRNQSVELINEHRRQDSLFQCLSIITGQSIPKSIRNDSLAFLILPVQASCPSCRKKTIDSIVKYQRTLHDRHFVVISAGGGRKTISGYFLEQDQELPVMENKLFLDSTNRAFRLDLVKDRPTIYYAHNGKVYKKVSSIPATVREDLQEFFSGYRNE